MRSDFTSSLLGELPLPVRYALEGVREAIPVLDLSRAGHFDEALEYCDKALELNPKLADVWNNKGACLNRLGRNQEAIECYDKALEINPREAST